MTTRILVLSASVGAGHLRAAQAVELALREVVPEATVRNVDVLELTNAPFRRLYGKFYLDLVNKAPHVLGYFYDLMDQPSRSGKNRTDRLRLAVEKLNLRKFIQLVKDEPWDLVINTHFLPAEIIASLRRKGELSLPQVTATTDFETHRLWVNQPCDHYFTATAEGARYLHHWGVPAGDITVTGIPIHPVFARPKDRGECLARHGLTGDRPILLQLSGGFGVGPIAKLYRALLDMSRPIELVTIAGRNETVKKELEAIEPPAAPPSKGAGFHRSDRRTDGRGRCGGVQARRPDDLGNAGARRGDGDRQSDTGTGEPQQRLSAGERRGHQGEQHRHAGVQDG